MKRFFLWVLSALLCSAQAELYQGELNGEPITYRIVGGYAVFQNDILLGPATKPSGQRESAFYIGNLWPGGVVPYELDPTFPATVLAQTQQAIATWNAYGTPIHLQPRSGETDYVRFTRSTGTTGVCSSAVGRRGGSQSVILEDVCTAPSIIHEIGHTVGFWHEQSRIDRNHNVTVMYENIAKDYAGNYGIQSILSGQDIAGYEYGSSMHYAPFSFSVDGKQAMESVPSGIPMGQGVGMNAGDLDAVSRKYGQIPTQTTISSNPLGLVLQVDGEFVTTPRVYSWAAGSRHTIAAPENPQVVSGPQYLYGKWSDGGARSHEITASSDVTVFTAHFVRRVPLTLQQPATGGTVSVNPPSPDGFYATYSQIKVTAEPAAGFRFFRWSPGGAFSCNNVTTSANPLTLPPRTTGYGCLPQFTRSAITTIDSEPSGQLVTVDGVQYAAPINFTFAAGSQHTISAVSPAAGFGSRTRFSEWSDGGLPSHTITATAEGGTVTARFTKQYLLTVVQPPSTLARIVVSPTSLDGFYDAGTVVSLQMNFSPGITLLYWSGDLVGRTNPATVVMDDQRLVDSAGTLTSALPVVTVLNSLTFQYGRIAPGQIVSLFGTDLGPPGGIGPTIDSSGKVATQSGGTRVLFDGTPAPVVYASPEQVNVVVPYGLAGATTTSVIAEYKGVQKAPVQLPVTAVSPSIVSNGAGAAVVVNEDGTYNGPDHPAKRGSVIVFFATGEGVTTPAGVDGRVGAAPLARPVQGVFVRIGGRASELLYAGNAPNFVAGAMQVNARVPDDAPSGEVSLYLIVGTAASPPITKMWVE